MRVCTCAHAFLCLFELEFALYHDVQVDGLEVGFSLGTSA